MSLFVLFINLPFFSCLFSFLPSFMSFALSRFETTKQMKGRKGFGGWQLKAPWRSGVFFPPTFPPCARVERAARLAPAFWHGACRSTQSLLPLEPLLAGPPLTVQDLCWQERPVSVPASGLRVERAVTFSHTVWSPTERTLPPAVCPSAPPLKGPRYGLAKLPAWTSGNPLSLRGINPLRRKTRTCSPDEPETLRAQKPFSGAVGRERPSARGTRATHPSFFLCPGHRYLHGPLPNPCS